MFAINHAATALLLKQRYPQVPLAIALISVQFVEILWVVFNYLGIEATVTERVVRYVGDIHLLHMPFSHSVATTLLFAIAAWLIGAALGRRVVGLAVALGIVSHLLLDIATHSGDIAIAPFITAPKLGTYLYSTLPALAFFFELGYGVFCWWVFKGSRSLLAVIVLFNLANISLFFVAIPGPEALFAGRPTLLVTVILMQIIVTLVAVGIAAKQPARGPQPSSTVQLSRSGADPTAELP